MPFLPEIHSDEETRRSMERGVLADHEVWVVEEEGITGFATLRNDSLEHLYVTPEAQRRSIGSALFAKATEVPSQLGHARRTRPGLVFRPSSRLSFYAVGRQNP
jgi:GNAT superfamily N-acetyltransferase